MRKSLIALLVASSTVGLVGCGAVDRFSAALTSNTKICVDGVTYLQFTSGATVQLDRTGKPVACN